jgi:N6-L-threonylcarbamoyladenine synthase
MAKKNLTILGIESSCDETAASVLRVTNNKVLVTKNIVSSQVKIHAQYGGIVPEVAARHHAENIIVVLQQALKSKTLDLKSIDAIAVTRGPGLITSLLVGVEAAKALAFLTKKPLIPVNHLLGHIYANWLSSVFSNSKSKVLNFKQFFPAICLIVSGGHTELVLMKDFEKFEKIGQTLDDAAGECFDKAAKILGLDYPGGPAIAAEAAKLPSINAKLPIIFPRPMINSGDFNFSFSGLKTAVLYKAQKMSKLEIRKNLSEICAEIQQSIIDVLIAKTIRAAKKFNVKLIILGGGVVANHELRRQFEEKVKREIPDSLLLIPNSKLCTDNAAMIAMAGYFKLKETSKKDWQKEFDWRKIKVDPNLEI